MWFSEDVTFANTTCSCIPVTAAGGLLPSTLATPPLYAISPQHLTQPRECSSRIRNRFPVFFLASYPLKIKAGSKNSFSANLCVLCASAVAISSFLTAEAQSTQRFAEKKRNQRVNRNTRQRSDLVAALPRYVLLASDTMTMPAKRVKTVTALLARSLSPNSPRNVTQTHQMDITATGPVSFRFTAIFSGIP
uniref:Uncharacterized protein n=1 Tax=Candidatus Kentrum sp. DK TaxID=2126562 RepID=A0A450T362_9GAMM|nr:MAG: hypothetical protein BECKDK2373C_GA0170839_10866 [Candidatus Kentron sp. DK]